MVGAVNIINVLTILHEHPRLDPAGPIVWEGSSWVTFTLFAWIPWVALNLMPLDRRPRWAVPIVHIMAAVVFSFCHVAGFLGLRVLVYRLSGDSYSFGAFGPQFLYELGKDSFGYTLSIAVYLVARYLVERTAVPAEAAGRDRVYSIRDGTRIMRVPTAEILAVSSAGNYVEFVLRDGRKPLMRSPLTAVESELAPHGFVRVHRSWLVNPSQVTGLKPEGSGDYTVELGTLRVPLSRRFPQALAKLKAA